MPETPNPKLRPHPFRAPADAETPTPRPATPYTELQVTTNFTFLTGASHPDELVAEAARLGHQAIAVTDTNTLAGVVRAHIAAREIGIRFIVGCRLVFEPTDGHGSARMERDGATDRHASIRADPPPSVAASLSVLVYPTDRPAYSNLCRLLTLGKRRAEKGQCRLTLPDLLDHQAGLLAVVVPPPAFTESFLNALRKLRHVFDDDRLSLAVCREYGPDDRTRLDQLALLSEHAGVPLVAVNNAHYHVPERRPLQDAITCVRLGCTISQAGKNLLPHGEFYLKPPDEMARLFAEHPRAIARTVEITERTKGFSLEQLQYEYPEETCPEGLTPQQHLADLAWQGVRSRHPHGIPEKICKQIQHELALIEELNYARYFLTVYDIVMYARAQGILCQGRGAAANSAVCYFLGVTAVHPNEINQLFERFVSRERGEPPDIDIDFEHERREDVIQYIYAKYGRDRAALTAEVITYRRRSAIRDIGKVLGLSLDLVDRLAKDVEWWDEGTVNPQRLRELGLNPADDTLKWFTRLVGELLGFPRHLSQHVGGFVMTRSPLCDLVPIENAAMENRTVIEWDKDDINALGMLKVDVLGLGMLTALRLCLGLVNRRRQSDLPPLSIGTIPAGDDETYKMIQRADTIGVFQIESRAQMSMLPRMKPKTFYDLVIEVAIVRPGPIQGGMVHPYLRRRSGQEPVELVHASIQDVLVKTLGVPLFQEQCMALAVKGAGFSPDEADQLRRAMASWKRKGDQIYRFGQMLIEGMTQRGISREFAERCFEQIKGFSEYGFPESHAASFAILVYASAWLKCHHPAEFCAALLNSQPMGFYPPAQLVRDAREHDVRVLPVDVNHSSWDCTIEEDGEKIALRLGTRLVNGVGEPDARKIRAVVTAHGPFSTILSLWRASGVKAATLRRLAAADAFTSMSLNRQEALWHTRALKDDPLPLFDGPCAERDAERDHSGRALPVVAPARQVAFDYAATGLSLKVHPVAFAREELQKAGVRPCADLRDPAKTPDGEWVAVGGLVLVRQRPGTAKDVTFMTLEDETGIASIVVWRRVYHEHRRQAAQRVVVVRGRVQRQEAVVHVVAEEIEAWSRQFDELGLSALEVPARNFH